MPRVEQQNLSDPADVDASVTRIGEASQSQGGNQRSGTGTGAAAAGQNLQQNPACCSKMRNQRGSHRNRSPYQRDWDQIRPWNRKRVQEEDPNRSSQELISSGNSIKEAVRRSQFSPDCRESGRGSDGSPCA